MDKLTSIQYLCLFGCLCWEMSSERLQLVKKNCRLLFYLQNNVLLLAARVANIVGAILFVKFFFRFITSSNIMPNRISIISKLIFNWNAGRYLQYLQATIWSLFLSVKRKAITPGKISSNIFIWFSSASSTNEQYPHKT